MKNSIVSHFVDGSQGQKSPFKKTDEEIYNL